MASLTVPRLDRLAIHSADELVFGHAPKPVECGFGLTIGAGEVYPEINFTLPAITIDNDTWPQVLRQYEDIATAIVRRCVALKVPGAVLEFELLPAMTEHPEWGAEITSLLLKHLEQAHRKYGLKSALRVTPVDVRERLRSDWERLRRSFALCIEAGAHIVSVESIGGKEANDPGLMYGDITRIVLGLGILAPRDVRWLWENIVSMCEHTVPGGDTACGFANTAMQLAHQKMLPEVLAAVVRAMSAVRSLAAYEAGARGPSKDCAYEGPVMKAIAGVPISMEGKSATCAHFSPLGNIASAMCDLWSNESVQNVRLLSGNAPEAFTESLIYDCRLMNVALAEGRERTLRDWLTKSDEWLSPQAAVLSPEATIAISRAIVAEDGDYRRTLAAGRAAISVLRAGLADRRLSLPAREKQWLDRIESDVDGLPEDEAVFLNQLDQEKRICFDPASYGLF
jgi:methanol--5-hydroxybenzimidazolylcobamide Co-methyltransferase